jgi:hypothetical protein
MDEKTLPRRIRLDLMTPEELALYNMVGEIEKLGAHPLLTHCVVLLGDARSKLSDWVDLQAAEQKRAADECQSHAWNETHTGFKFCPDCGNPLTRR